MQREGRRRWRPGGEEQGHACALGSDADSRRRHRREQGLAGKCPSCPRWQALRPETADVAQGVWGAAPLRSVGPFSRSEPQVPSAALQVWPVPGRMLLTQFEIIPKHYPNILLNVYKINNTLILVLLS